jgi:hypothetical protein
MSMNRRLATIAQILALVAFMAMPCLAQTEGGSQTPPPGAPSEEAYQHAMQVAATPGPQHALLAEGAGRWHAETKMWMAPGQEPQVSHGEVTSEMILGGRYRVDHFSSEVMGIPMEGVGITGYDNVRQEFASVWIDDMGTGVAYMTGQADPSGKVITMTGVMTDPLTKQEMKMRSVSTQESPDRVICVFFMTMPDGSEMKNMEFVYTRVK